MENTISVIKQVELTHKNLGIPVVLSKLIDLSNLGMFIVAERGRGKGAILEAIKQLRHRETIEITRITPAGLVKIAEQLSNREITLINPDISSLYTPYLKETVINTLSHLIFDRRMPQSWTGQYAYKIENCTISFLAGVQPKLLRELNKMPDWESMYKDRFLRLCLIYPFGTPVYIKKYPQLKPIQILKSAREDVVIPDFITDDPEYRRLKQIMSFQTSEGRSGIYLDRLLQSSAYFNCREAVIKEDLEFLSIASIYFLLDYWLSDRASISESFKFDPSSYIMLFYLIQTVEASRKEMKQHFRVSQSSIMRALEPLKAKAIVTGVYGEDVYHLNPEWYNKYIKPIVEYGRQIGIVETFTY